MESARQMRARLAQRPVAPREFREALLAVGPSERDAWVDSVLGLSEVAGDGASLPRGCVPYLPCPVDALLRAVDVAEVGVDDVIVDVGSGLGRAAVLMQLLSGASAIGVEIQPDLAAASRRLAERVKGLRFTVVEGDAVEERAALSDGSVFFLYCPFSGERLTRLLASLEALAGARRLRVCCVDLPLPHCPWLEPVGPDGGALAVYRSVTGIRRRGSSSRRESPPRARRR
ncbi:MAG: hypothetical protein AB1938_27950 [Myxococcota bacterium]